MADVPLTTQMRTIAEACREKYPDKIEKAIEATEKQFRRIKEISDLLFHTVASHAVHQARHRVNVVIRKEAGKYTPTPIVVPAESESVQKSYRSMWLNYNIGGKLLGDLLGCELACIESHERSKGRTHTAHADFLHLIRETGIGAEQSVAEFVDSKKLDEFAKAAGLAESMGIPEPSVNGHQEAPVPVCE